MERNWKGDPDGMVGKGFLEQVVVHRMTGAGLGTRGGTVELGFG